MKGSWYLFVTERSGRSCRTKTNTLHRLWRQNHSSQQKCQWRLSSEQTSSLPNNHHMLLIKPDAIGGFWCTLLNRKEFDFLNGQVKREPRQHLHWSGRQTLVNVFPPDGNTMVSVQPYMKRHWQVCRSTGPIEKISYVCTHPTNLLQVPESVPAGRFFLVN